MGFGESFGGFNEKMGVVSRGPHLSVLDSILTRFGRVWEGFCLLLLATARCCLLFLTIGCCYLLFLAFACCCLLWLAFASLYLLLIAFAYF